MGDLRHLVLVKFKEGVAVEEVLEDMAKLATTSDTVKSFEWGQGIGDDEALRQGFTHVFIMAFKNAEDFRAFASHPNHLEFAQTFSAAIDKVLLFDFPAVAVKP